MSDKQKDGGPQRAWAMKHKELGIVMVSIRRSKEGTIAFAQTDNSMLQSPWDFTPVQVEITELPTDVADAMLQQRDRPDG